MFNFFSILGENHTQKKINKISKIIEKSEM